MAVNRIVGLCPTGCEVCDYRGRLCRCRYCLASFYCGRQHREADRARHQEACNEVKEALSRLKYEEGRLREKPEDGFTPPRSSEPDVGHDWLLHESKKYMKARVQLVDTLLEKMGSAGARVNVIQAALDHLLDIQRLWRSDSTNNYWNVIPVLLIRLGREQEAYDYMKWYATTGFSIHYDWSDLSAPMLDIHDANMLEPVSELWVLSRIELSHAAAVALIKIKMLLSLRDAQNATRALRGTLPDEIVDMVRDQIVSSIFDSEPVAPVPNSLRTIWLMEKIQIQIRELYDAINRGQEGRKFWYYLLNDPNSQTHLGLRHYARTALFYGYAAWAETPGALDVIKGLAMADRKDEDDSEHH